MFKKILIANRGEIAVRIMKAARELGIRTVAIYAKPDEKALHVRKADESYYIGEEDLIDSYLNIRKIVDVAVKSGCEAIHPGYGFLAENPAFSKACKKAGLIFIGPSERALSLMGNKIKSREFVQKLGIPMTAGITGSVSEIPGKSSGITFPVLVKAAAGGGGKGMRIVSGHKALREALEQTSREAKSYFGDGTVYLEQYIENPRHIEVQELGDHHGNLVHLFERECTIQRRYQKIIEESPSPTLTPDVRMKMGDAAVKIARAIKYTSAGTVEFLVDKDLHFYFLEMNTRIQVEHPVTELVTGIDLVKEQILIATGKPLGILQKDIRQKGHAIECRIYAEDPKHNFIPSPGKITLYEEPTSAGVRVDSGFDQPAFVESIYDPMICKLITSGKDREEARGKMKEALKYFVIHGIVTNINYLTVLLDQPEFIKNKISTTFCDRNTPAIIGEISKRKNEIPIEWPAIAAVIYSLNKKVMGEEIPGSLSIWEKIGHWRDIMAFQIMVDDRINTFSLESTSEKAYIFHFDNREIKVKVMVLEPGKLKLKTGRIVYDFSVSNQNNSVYEVGFSGFNYRVTRMDVLPEEETTASQQDKQPAANGSIPVVSPLPGKVIKINVKQGVVVKKGASLAVVEAMKMENQIKAPVDSMIEKIVVKEGDKVDGGETMLILKAEA